METSITAVVRWVLAVKSGIMLYGRSEVVKSITKDFTFITFVEKRKQMKIVEYSKWQNFLQDMFWLY